MKTAAFCLALGALLNTAQAQTTPAEPTTAPAAHQVVVVNRKAIGRKFITKSKPTDMLMPVPLAKPEVITRPK